MHLLDFYQPTRNNTYSAQERGVTMWTLVVLISLVVCVFGVMSVAYPFGFLGIKTRMRGLALFCAGLVGLVVGAANHVPVSNIEATSVAAATAVAPTTAAAPVAVAKPAVLAPSAQLEFVRIVEDARAEYRRAETDFQKGATRPARSRKLCQSSLGSNLTDWLGKVSALTTNGDGNGVVSIELTNNVTVKTWNNSFSDISHGTLVKPETRVFRQLATLRKGDRVKFSGRLFKSDTDCFSEGSATLSGSVNDPEFLVAFNSIEKL